MPDNERYLKDLLAENGITYRSVAREAECRPATVWHVVNNLIASKRILGIVAEKLNISIDEAQGLLPPKAA